MSWYREWRPYVPVAKRRAKAAAYAARLAKKEKRTLCPVKIEGRKIATSFWGQAWCDNLERYSDYANRLPRGRTYVRNGSVIDLQISRGKIKSIVSGSEIYRIEIEIAVLKKALWNCVKRDCSNSIDSLLDLLQGRFDRGVMERLTQRDVGLFPQPKEIKMRCSCPDWAGLCKHLAATLYGVGARLDDVPELMFTLRGVDHLELISEVVGAENLDRALGTTSSEALVDAELGDLFGIEIDRGTNDGSATNESRAAAKQNGVVQRPRNRPSTAGSSSARQKKTKSAEREAVARNARPKTRPQKKSAPKTANAETALATATASRRTKPKRQTVSGAAPTSAKKRSRATASTKERIAR